MQRLQKGSLPYTELMAVLKHKKEVHVMEVLDFLQAEEIIQLKKDGTVVLC